MIANPKTPKSPYLSALEAIQRGKATPSRRKSLKHIRQRESPWDVLKLLSRTLAPKTLPPPASPTTPAEPGPTKRTSRRSSVTFFEESSNYDNDDDDDTGELPPAPRLSMDLNSLVDQENERFARREIPRSSLLPEDIHTGDHSEQSLSPPITVRSAEDVDTTAREIELPRRAVSERPMFDIRLSDRFHDLDRMQRIDRENARRESTIFGGTDRRESMGLNFRDNDDPAPDGVYYSSDDDNEQFDQLHYG